MKRKIIALLTMTLLVSSLWACQGKPEQKAENENLDTSESVNLTVCGAWSASKAMEDAANRFTKKYPNCQIKYEYVQNYDEMIAKRLEDAPDSVDLFITSNIQSDSAVYPYAEELFAHKELDLSSTNEALIKNFTLKNSEKEGQGKIYAIPLGGELRGMYVNKTLLASLGLEIPENATELLAACQTLKDAGYIPMNGNPGIFGQRLLYPYVCNLVANAEDYQGTYDRVNECEAGVSEIFRDPMEFAYTLMSNGYYNYKYVETEYEMFIDNSDEGCARDFFHIVKDGGEYTKADDMGTVAFTSGTLTQKATMDKVKEDYHSKIEYEFVLAPVSEEGGYAYVSPSSGIAVNKNSSNVDWAVEFLNYIFSEEGNTQYASDSNYIPNTADSFQVIQDMFDVPENQVSNLGQVTFSYDFYTVITDSLVNISKGNNPKYMNTDSQGNATLYDFEYYMNQLEESFAANRGAAQN